MLEIYPLCKDFLKINYPVFISTNEQFPKNYYQFNFFKNYLKLISNLILSKFRNLIES